MKKFNLSDKSGVTPFKIMEEGKLDLTDLSILKKLLEGKTIKQVSKELQIVEKTVSNRLDSMERNHLLVKRQAPIVDILQLYNYLFITYVKIHLSAAIPEITTGTRPTPIPGATVRSTPPPPSWLEMLTAIENTDKELFQKLVRYAFVVMGTEWDLVLIMSTQSIEEYTKFFSQLQSKGFIEKVEGHTVVTYAGYHYDPIAVPDPEEVVEGLKHVQKFLTRNKEVVT